MAEPDQQRAGEQSIDLVVLGNEDREAFGLRFTRHCVRGIVHRVRR